MADKLFDAVEREPLFPDMDDLPEKFPTSDFGIQMHLQQIQKIDHEIERLKAQQEAQNEWFRQRFLRLAEARDHHEAESFRTLKEIGEKSCATPYGTAFIRKSTTTIWPDDSTILAWVKEQGPKVAEDLLKKKEQPDKTAIKEYMKTSGKIVPGYETKEAEALSIRKAA